MFLPFSVEMSPKGIGSSNNAAHKPNMSSAKPTVYSGTLVNVWNKTWSINKEQRLLPSFQCSAWLAWRLNIGWWTWLTWESCWFQERTPAAWSSRDAPHKGTFWYSWYEGRHYSIFPPGKTNAISSEYVDFYVYLYTVYEQLNSLVHVLFYAESKIIFTSLRKTDTIKQSEKYYVL